MSASPPLSVGLGGAGGRGESLTNGEQHGDICTTKCKTDIRSLPYDWELKSGLSDNPEGWDGVGSRREV